MADSPRDAFIRAAVWFGPLEEAEAIRAAHPGLDAEDLHAAALLGDAGTVAHCLKADPANVRNRENPLGWDPLTLLCFSRYLRCDRSRAARFVETARLLLDAGADPKTGWYNGEHSPAPVFESALYGAAGMAQCAPLTALLIERGADPNDDEVPYHVPESYDLDTMRVLLESQRLSPDSLAMMLVRKADWHDFEGIKLLLESGADPDRMTMWGYTPFHQSLRRDNVLPIIELFLRHGADPLVSSREGHDAFGYAALRGRGDVLTRLRGLHGLPLEGPLRFLAACACDEDADPVPVEDGGARLAEFAANGNTAGVARLVAAGVAVDSLYAGDGYFQIAPQSTALHCAAWRLRPETVRVLLELGATADAMDAHGRTPLMLAVLACTDSYWTVRRTPVILRDLLRAGADPRRVPLPTGYPEADELLRAAL